MVEISTAPNSSTTTYLNCHSNSAAAASAMTTSARRMNRASALSGASFTPRQRAARVGGSPPRLSYWPAFDDLDEARQPCIGLVAVDHAVVDGEGHIGHRMDKHCVPAVHRAHHDALLELAHAEDCGLPLVKDDRRGEERA